MGSRATRDRDLMAALLRAARNRNLYFIDSRTSPRSIAFATARELEAIARSEGYAIGIGHPFPETLDAIREILPALARRGVKLVFASELAG